MYHKWNKWKPVVIIELCKQNEILLNTDYFVAKNAYMPPKHSNRKIKDYILVTT